MPELYIADEASFMAPPLQQGRWGMLLFRHIAKSSIFFARPLNLADVCILRSGVKC